MERQLDELQNETGARKELQRPILFQFDLYPTVPDRGLAHPELPNAQES